MVLGTIFTIVYILISIPLTIFWFIMVLDAIKTNKEQRELWIAITIITGVLGAIIYYIMIFQKQRHILKKPDFSLIGINNFLNSIPKIISTSPQDQQIAWYAIFAGVFLLIIDMFLWLLL